MIPSVDMRQAASSKGNPWPPWRCPAHGLNLAEAHDALTCPAGHSFPIRAGIPRFVDAPGYAAPFGPQWRRYRRTQLDSYTGTEISEQRARRCLGETLWGNLADRQILEC